MRKSTNQWRTVLILSIGLAVASAICMKWLESNFVVDGKRFSILGLELFYDRSTLDRIYGGMDAPVRQLLQYHCRFDFVFMAGVYPALAAGCVLIANRSRMPRVKRLFRIIALLQVVAWGCDIAENYFLLHWIKNGQADDRLELFHLVSSIKWVLALVAVLLLVFAWLRRRSWMVD